MVDTAPVVGTVLGLPEPDRLARLVAGLRDLGHTVAAAESLTGGLLTATLTAIPGASAVVRGALVVYATDLKATLAGVPDDLLAERGPVDPDVAVALARGARAACGSTIGLGLTGVAGPDPQVGSPPGTWYVAMATPDGAACVRSGAPTEQLVDVPDALAGRTAIRELAVTAAVELLESFLAAPDPDPAAARRAGRAPSSEPWGTTRSTATLEE